MVYLLRRCLSRIKNKAGFAGEPVIVNRNGELKLVVITRDIFNEYFRIIKANGKIDIEKELFEKKEIIIDIRNSF